MPFGALEASSDPRAAGLRDGTIDEPLVVAIDDAHDLDSASLHALLRGVHTPHVSALFAVTEPRLGARAIGPEVERLHDLWLSGAADRLDLRPLQTDDGAQLLAEFSGGHRLDSVTRAAILWQADGSRALLRALTEIAIEAALRGDDPIQAIDDVSAHSRLAATVHAHIRGFDDEVLRALVLLDHTPGLSFGDAARFIPSATLNALRAAGLLHDDQTIMHRFTANRAIARAAARHLGPAAADEVVKEALDRLISDRGLWWNAPLARLLAEHWLRDVPDAASLPGEVPIELVRRVMSDAAREANDHGDASSAAAYATWAGAEAATAVLSLEEHLAHTALGSSEAAGLRLDALPAEGQRRTLSVALALALPVDASATERSGTPEDDRPPRTTPDHELAAARQAIDALQIRRADEIVARLRAHPQLDTADRVDTELLAATIAAYLGRDEDMRVALRTVQRLLRSGERRGSAIELLRARCLDLAARTIVGDDDTATLVDLAADRDFAARRGGASLALAGAASVLALLRRGHVLEARLELTASLNRSPLLGGTGQGMLTMETALGLALFGYTSEARDVLDAVNPPHGATNPLYRHMMEATQATLALAEGRWDDARTHAAAAWQISSTTDAVMLQVRCLHRLIVVRHPDADEALDRLRAIAETVQTDAIEMILRSAERAAADEALGASAALAHLCLDLCPPELLRRGHARRAVAADAARDLLTAREREIAGLVHEGLTNRQIAHALFLSVRTVESHIYQARSKIGARNRSDLGSMVGTDRQDEDEPRRSWA
ncbi:LuxR C-terminal-related transcriptional regulator [Microbacterium oleivorans]|uniref:LuxR C-terminal-related transcriptional regulator n=1 Tax=Microbacterium oleivorans TaxID=273677 RepID=UPI0021163151|nr:LuxR C-terminal-related transcriptional regulator [Microbacterium oleivorans]